jgi:aminoglycoside 3-N-acetyltransferase I
MSEVRARRLIAGDRAPARRLFALLAAVFEEDSEPLSDSYLDHLLGRADFWAIAAYVDGDLVGGLTAHALPLTRAETFELFIYDIAVRSDHQRRGIGRHLVAALRDAAADVGIRDTFVPADNADQHALDFYRALGGVATPVTFFTFSDPGE